MISRFAVCLLLVPHLVWARAAHQAPAPPPAPVPLTPPAMCDAAIASAEAAHKLPMRVLAAIGIRESGRADPETGRTRPWPWTINFEGAGHVYPTKEAAIAAVQEIQTAGGQSIDVGCMQVNLMHHAGAFASLDEAFDPKANALYAGRFLKSLFGSLGDWGTAIAAYHSRTPGKSEAYRDQVVASWHPTDPAVLAKLSLTPLPALPEGVAVLGGTAGISAGMRPLLIPIGPNMAYRAFIQTGALLPSPAYRSFLPANVAYADFGPKAGKRNGRTGGRPLTARAARGGIDLRLDSGLMGSGKALVVPSGVIDRGSPRPGRPMGTQAARSSRENG